MGIKFGTDGWRAVLDKDFTKDNVRRVTLAIGKYVEDNFGLTKSILVGYDPRKMADVYSYYCAELLRDMGFKVLYSKKVIPTPVLAYNALEKNACAIMFTASHNPPEYLGMKFIPDYAGPATSEITDEVVSNIDKPVSQNVGGKLVKEDFSQVYYEQLEKLIDIDSIKKIKTNIIYDGLYSASIGYFDDILKKHGIDFSTLHMYHDTNFGGGMPDPKPKYMAELISRVKEIPNSIGVANDGDADRFGIINEQGEYVSPNEIISILLKYLHSRGIEGAVVKTVGSSLLIDNVAKKLCIPVIETAVGFKHIGEAMRRNKVIIGGEESGGLSIQGHIPEKDGLLANLLVLEAMSSTGKSLVELQKELYELAGCKFYTDRIDKKLEKREEIVTILNKAQSIDQVGGYKVTTVETTDGVKLMLGDKTKILVRPSGTEPLLRIYFETDSLDKLEILKKELKL